MGSFIIMLINSIAASLIAQHTGTVFTNDGSTMFYKETVHARIQIRLPTPRLTLDYLAYQNCFLCNNGGPVDQCEPQFAEFDTKIFAFLQRHFQVAKTNSTTSNFSDFAKQIEDTSNARRQKQCITEQIKIEELRKLRLEGDRLSKNLQNMSRRRRSTRTRRFDPLTGAVVLGVGVAAVVGYMWDDEMSEEIETNQADILHLKHSINAMDKDLAFLAKSLKADPTIVLTGDSSLPFDIRRESSFVIRNGIKSKNDLDRTFHISRHAQQQYSNFQQRVLTLQNQRLPLDEIFLISVRARCLSLQKELSETTQRFCNELAFLSTKMDTTLNFKGIGLTFVDSNQTKIDSIIYNFNLQIPILEQHVLPHIRIINLGRFKASNVLAKIEFPEFAIISQNGEIHGLDVQKCTKTAMRACPSNAIMDHNECLAAIYKGNTSDTCNWQISHEEDNCLNKITDKTVVVSLTTASEVHFDVLGNRHLENTYETAAFDIVQRRKTSGQLRCPQSNSKYHVPEIQIPALMTEVTEIFDHQYTGDINHLKTVKNVPITHNTLSDIIDDIQNQTTQNKVYEQRMASHTNETKSTWKKLEQKIENIPKETKAAFHRIFWPLFSPVVTFAVIAVILAIIALRVMKRRKKEYKRPIVNFIRPTNENNRAENNV